LKYRAFISYSHADEKLAARLHRKLEAFKLPANLGEASGKRTVLRPIFRDRSELATSSRLSDAIEEALSDSDALIVVCSPAACRSKWVNEEIRTFRRRHPDRPVLSFVVGGKPEADPRQSEEAAFPLALLQDDVDDPESAISDPLAADARPEGDGFQVAMLKLVAGLVGVGFDDLWRREQKATQRRWAVLSAVLLTVTITFGILTWQAIVARDEARRAQATAQLELTSEQQTRRFLLSIFELSNAGEARGNDVTVRSVLDRAVATIDATDFAKPVVKSRLLATMGQAYSSLGLHRPSVRLLQRSIELLGTEDEADLRQRIANHIELADVYFVMGRDQDALAELEAAREEIERSEGDHDVQLARLENVVGDVLTYYTDDSDAARQAYSKALRLTDAMQANPEAIASIRGRSLGGFGLLEFHHNRNPEGAEIYFAQAHEVLLEEFGSAHPETNWALGSLGGAAWLAGDLELGRSSLERALEYASLLYDPGNPELGTLQNNLARLALEQGDVARAGELLEQALQSDRQHRAEDFDGLVLPLNNLAVVRIHAGDFEGAAALLEEAAPIAESRDHWMKGSVLTLLADVRCEQGRASEGEALIERALTTLQQNGDEAWRIARARITRDFCAGRPPSPADLEILSERWGPENPFVLRARAQADAATTST
ncbi:MAG: toll/interleukin-1 receptor domain-containing protein, partial [Wenzhouxiangellaceae bacterium]|nr:toll/interleukin-1 receptor domain-containing protein [Wenzhouxiangellaceae bacterium]